MDHPNQNTMLLPASYAVISEEEMTYLDGGQSIYLGSAFNHDIYFNTDQFATFCQNAAINLFVLMTNYSFRYIAGRVQSGLSNGLSLSGTFYHTWDKMNTWSRIASVGVAGLAGVYVYSQTVDGDGRNGDARRHLYDGQQRIHALEAAAFQGDADDRQRRIAGNDTGQMSSHTGTDDKGTDAPFFGCRNEFPDSSRRAVGRR